MHRRTSRRLLSCTVVLAGLTMGSGLAVDAAASRAEAVDMATVAVGSLARSGRSETRTLPLRADLIGATWSGTARGVELRARAADGAWSRWVDLEAGSDGPDPGSAEARAARQRSGRTTSSNPVWVGDAEAVQVRAHGRGTATDVRVVAINATGTATRGKRVARTLRSGAAWVRGGVGGDAVAQPRAPGIRSRTTWGASVPRSTPSIGDAGVLGMVVHHTAGTNRYSCTQVPALLRGIQRYHMRTNGWNDIGYNYLVDACGGVWEGRAGGLTKAVIGAHTAGFNTSTTGVALIGNHVSVRPTAKARAALQRLVAWRLDVARVAPTGTMALVARSSDKFPVGSRVVARAVSGHRDLFPTSCPGGLAYRDLGALVRASWRGGGVKVANITVSSVRATSADPIDAGLVSATVRAVGNTPGMTLTARLERSSTGEVLRTASVVGTAISMAWGTSPGAPPVPAWDMRVVVDGSIGAHRARSAAVPLVANLTPDPGFVVTTPPEASVAPGGDPIDDRIQLQYTLASRFQLGATLHDPTTGEQVAVLRAPGYVPTTAIPTPLGLAIPRDVPDGAWELRVGLPNDPAAGRSIRRFPITITRST